MGRHWMLGGWMIALLAVGCASAGRQAAWEKQPRAMERPADTEQAATTLEQAKAEWAKRDSKDAVLRTIQLLEQAVEQNPKDAEALILLSRAYYFLVDGHLNVERPEDLDELKLKYHELGADYGERALLVVDPGFEQTMRAGGEFMEAIAKIEKPAVPAAYWYCTNLGRFAVAKGLSAKLFYKDRVAAAMKRIQEVDPDYFYAAADRYLGAYYSALPSIAGKDLDKSAEHFDASIQRAPEYVGTVVLKAEFLAVERDDQEMYESLLKKALASPDGDNPDIAPENRAAKRTAEMFLKPEEIEERF